MNEKLCDALDEIRDEYIDSAARREGRRHWKFISAVAAVLALAIVMGVLLNPREAAQLGIPMNGTTDPNVDYLKTYAIPLGVADYEKHQAVDPDAIWQAGSQLKEFYGKAMSQILLGSGENRVFSPVNLYMSLCLLAELSDGDPQIMTLLGVKSLDELRQQASQIWNACYADDPKFGNKCILANSVWLDDGSGYDKEKIEALTQYYYTSSYQGDLGSEQVQWALYSWLKEQTAGILPDECLDTDLNHASLALYSTVFFRAEWADGFEEAENQQGVFHGKTDTTCTYMHIADTFGSTYHAGEGFTAVCMKMKGQQALWLILPDEGLTPEDLLQSGDYLDICIRAKGEPDGKQEYDKLHITIPKFDVQGGGSLEDDLKAMGVTNIFFQGTVDRCSQFTRVAIDEKGMTAASYTENIAMGLSPIQRVVDFVLDRPFLFVCTTSTSIPLFAGVVNEIT